MTKKCTKCNQIKLVLNFYKNRAICKPCYKIHYLSFSYEKRQKIKEYDRLRKDKRKDGILKKIYGIDLIQWKLMLDQQENKCYICSKTFDPSNLKEIQLDHDHITNKIRKLLCTKCNLSLGYNKNTDVPIWVLENTLQYLDQKKDSTYKYYVSWRHSRPGKFQLLLNECNNKCEICKMQFLNTSIQTNPYVDHNHKSGFVRGILCNSCNSRLGMIQESPSLILACINYIKEHI